MFNKKKNIFITLSLLLSVGLYTFYQFNQSQSPSVVTANKGQDRTPASIDNKLKKIMKNKGPLAPAIKKKIKNHFKTSFPKQDQLTKWEITPLRNNLSYKNHPYKNYKHVKISFEYKNKYGSMEALIDPRTGSALRTWNSTRYEFRKPAMLDISDRALAPLED